MNPAIGGTSMGQHRVVAQLDQGVKQTIIQRLELLDPDTGQPAPD